MTPTELHQTLRSYQIRPKKRLSQNFLIDSNIAYKIIATLDPKKRVLEIGPGLGALTRILLEQGFCLTAIEKDRQICSFLRHRFDGLELYEEDFLTWDCSHLDGNDVQIVSNLPYHITTPILEKILLQSDIFSSATLMMQKEVARRIIAKPRTKDYSSLSVFLQSYAHIGSLFTVSPSCFYPRPQVASGVISFQMAPKPPKGFSHMVRLAFGKRRKTLVNALKEEYDQQRLIPALEQMGFNMSVRAEELNVGEFRSIFETCS